MNKPSWKAYRPRWIGIPALVADVELTHPAIAIPIDPRYRTVRALIRVHGRPVGYADIAAGHDRMLGRTQILRALDPDTVVRASEHLLADLRGAGVPLATARPCLADLLALHDASAPTCAAADPTAGPLVSVAICTRDRAWSLGATLDSLLRQSYTNFEIMVVDNAPPNDSTERLVRGDYPAARYIHEPQAGLDHARNRAMREARGEIVAFIDDDAIADVGWLSALVPLFDDPRVLCATGLVAPALLDTPGQELFERFGYSKGFERVLFRLDMPPHPPGFPYKGYIGTGCNCALRRGALDLVGPFDPRLDMGTPVPGGGDHDMFARIIRAGYALVYDPAPVVFHQHIAELALVVKRLGQYQESFLAFMTKAMLSDHTYTLTLACHMSYWYVRKTVRGVGAALKKRDRPLALVLSEALGAWRGPVALYRSHHQATRLPDPALATGDLISHSLGSKE